MASNTSIKTKFSKGIDLVDADIINVSEIYATNSGTVTIQGDLTVTGGFTLPTDGDLVPASNNNGNVGQENLRWSNGHFVDLNANELYVDRVGTDLIPDQNSRDLGNTTNTWTAFTDRVNLYSNDPQIFLREGDITDNNYRISVVSGQFKVDRVDNNNSSPTNVFYTENDGTVVFGSDVFVSGNLQINGDTLVVNATALQLEDTFITLNEGLDANTPPSQNAGVAINRGSSSNVQILWDESNDTWNLTGNYSIVNHTDGGGAYVLVTSNSNATYGDSVFVTGNVVVTDNVVLTSTTNTGIIFTDGAGSNLEILFDNTTSNTIGIVYANGTFDRIATVNADARSYDLTTVANTAANQGLLRLSDDNNANDTVNFVGSGSITVASNATQITITGTDNHTTYGISAAANASNANVALTATGSNTTASAVKFIGSGATTVNSNGTGTVTIHSTDNNDDTTYTISAVANTSGANLSLTAGGSGSGSDQVTFAGSGATSVTRTSADVITISSTDNNDNTTYDLSIPSTNNSIANVNLTAGGSGSGTDTIKFTGSGLVTVSCDTTTVTITGSTPGIDAVLAVDNSTTTALTVGNFTTTGTSTLGNATSDTITMTGRVGSSIVPSANNTYDLGSSTLVWRNIYTGDLNMSNMDGDPNEVDGTHGSWTFQEGEDDLFLINRRNGKKYKFKLEEVK